MAGDDKIASELAELEGWLGGFDSPAPSERVVEAVKARVRLELGEVWLAGMGDPLPDAATVGRVREAARRELRRMRHPRRRWSWAGSQGFGALAAAAMIMLAVGVAWRASFLMRPARGLSAVDAMVLALAADKPESDLQIVSLADELDELEAELWHTYETDGEVTSDQLEILEGELERIERETEKMFGAS